MKMSKSFPDDIDKLTFINTSLMNIGCDLNKRRHVIGFEFECINKIFQGLIIIMIFHMNHAKNMIDGIGTKINLKIILADLLCFFYGFGIEIN